METRDLKDLVVFSDDGPSRQTIFESERLWAQLLGLGRNQSYGPVTDPDADGMFTIVAGEAVFLVGRKRKRLRQWGAVLVPAGAQVSITNASGDPLVLLLVTAPPPVPPEVTG